MGLKSREIDHLLIRQLKLTANKPVTKPALLRTVSRWAHKLISCYNSSIISILDSSYPSKFASVWTFISADSKQVPDTANILIVARVVVIEIAIVEVQFATVIAVAIVDRTTPVVIADER